MARTGAAENTRSELNRKVAEVTKQFGNLAEEGYTPAQIASIDLDKIKEANEKAAAEAAKADREEKIRQTIRLQNIDNENEQRLSKLQSYYAIEQATLDSNLRQTLEQEKTFAAARGRLQSEDLKAQIAATKKFYNEKIGLVSNVDDAETAKLTNERNTKIRELNTQLVVNEIDTQKQLKEISKRILDERRAALIEFNSIQIQGIGQQLESQVFDIERVINLQITTAEDGFQKLIAVNFNAFERIYDLTYQNYVKQLDDTSLTAEQRKNITAQMYQELEGLTESHNRKVLELDNRRYAEQINRLESFSRRAQSLFESQASVFGGIGGFFQPESFSKKSLTGFSDTFLGDSFSKEITRLEQRRDAVTDELNKLLAKRVSGGVFSKEEAASVAILQQRYEDLSAEINKTGVDYLEFNKNITSTEREILALGKSLTTTAGAFENFDRIAEKALFAQQEKELAAFTTQLDFANAKLKILSTQYESQLVGAIRAVEAEMESLKGGTIGSIEDSALKRLQVELDNANKALNDFKSGAAKTEGILDAENAITVLENSLKNLTSKQAQERIEQFSRSIAGLKETLKDLQSGGAATRNALQNIFTKDLLEEQIGQYTEIEAIKFRLANTPLINAQSIEISQLEEIIRLRNIEQEKAASKAIVGNRVNILDNLSRQQREQALIEKQTEQSRIAAGQVASLARIKGLENEEELKTQILKDTAEKYLEIERKYQESLGNIKAGDSAVRPKAENLDAFDNLSGAAKFGLEIVGIDKIQTAEEIWISAVERMKDTTKDAFGQMASAVGQSVEAWVLYGDAVGESLQKAAAATLASVAAQATTQAVWETAQGLAMLALNFFIPNPAYTASAAAHFAAAGTYGAIAVGTALVGRAVAGNSFNQGGAGGNNSNQGQPDYYSNYPTPQQPTQQQQQITPQQVQRTGERAEIAELKTVIQRLSDSIQKQGEPQVKAIEALAQAVTNFDSKVELANDGDIFMRGAKKNPGVFGTQTLQDLKTFRTSPTEFRKAQGLT